MLVVQYFSFSREIYWDDCNVYLFGYNAQECFMRYTVYEYRDFLGRSPYAKWLNRLRDPMARAKIILRVDKMELGLFGDVEPVGEGLSELRIHYGPGYRVYFAKVGRLVYLLSAGNKSTQAKDIKKAKARWRNLQRRNNDDYSCQGNT